MQGLATPDAKTLCAADIWSRPMPESALCTAGESHQNAWLRAHHVPVLPALQTKSGLKSCEGFWVRAGRLETPRSRNRPSVMLTMLVPPSPGQHYQHHSGSPNTNCSVLFSQVRPEMKTVCARGVFGGGLREPQHSFTNPSVSWREGF